MCVDVHAKTYTIACNHCTHPAPLHLEPVFGVRVRGCVSCWGGEISERRQFAVRNLYKDFWVLCSS
jgi:hypothetical protein